MKNIFFLILLSPFLYSQDYQVKDSIKTLAMSKFTSMETFENKNGQLIPKKNYTYDQNKNEITIKNMSVKDKEWIKTIIRLDKDYNIQEEERVVEGMIISEKENISVKKQISMIKKYHFINNTFQIESFDSKGNLSIKDFNLLDDKNRVVESIHLLNSSNSIIVAQIERYNWIDEKNYHYEKLTFNAPKSKVTGIYTLNKYGEREFFKGNIAINGETEVINTSFKNKQKKFDAKGNIIKLYALVNGKEEILEERRIIYQTR